MAYQRQQTQRNFRFPLIGSFQNRTASGDKDQRFINFYAESLKNPITENKKIYLVKRPGTNTNTTLPAAAEGRGVITWKSHKYSAVGSNLYKDSTSLITLTTTTGHVGMIVATNDSGQILFVHDGAYGYVVYEDGTWKKVPLTLSAWVALTPYILDDLIIPTVVNGFYYTPSSSGVSGAAQPTWPTTIGDTVVDGTITWRNAGYYDPTAMPKDALPYPVYLNGCIYLIAKRTDGSNSDAIYNCDVDNPLSWGTSNFINAESFPDELNVLGRQSNMIVALGENSCEFFYAGSDVDSPLLPNESLEQEVGCVAPNTLAQQEKFCIFVGNSDTGAWAVWVIDGFTPTKISDEYIEKIIQAEDVAIADATGWVTRTNGHIFYVLQLYGQDRTLVYDLEERMWHEWSSNNGLDQHVGFNGVYGTEDGTGNTLILGLDDGVIYSLSPEIYQDNGVSILADAITTKYDFESMNRKFMHNLNVVGDQITGDTVKIRWTDDDYRTWSNWKTLSLTTRSFFTQLGKFRRRAFELLYTGNNPYRVEALEVEVSLGTH